MSDDINANSNADPNEPIWEAPPQEREMPAPLAIPLPEESADNRRAGRFPVERVSCDLGTVCDISSSGLRLDRRTRLPAGKPVVVVLSDGDTAIRIPAEIRREVKHGLFKWEYGLQFVNVSPEIKRALAAIAFSCRERRVI
ncbi:MAG: PilZ domain-containing protein [Phycisphaerales bacterium]